MKNNKKKIMKAKITILIILLAGIILVNNSRVSAASIVIVDSNDKEQTITKEQFLKQYGCYNKKAIYKYYNENGKIQLELYYNTSTKKGCGIRYTYYNGIKRYGFSFEGYSQQKGFNHKKYSLVPENREEGDGSKYVTGYKTSKKYEVINNSKKIVKFISTGILKSSDSDVREEIVSISFKYDKKGELKKKEYKLNSFIYGTYESSYTYYYDKQKRLSYKESYVSHGSLEYYYIYNGKNNTPSNILILDDNLGMYYPYYVKITK